METLETSIGNVWHSW